MYKKLSAPIRVQLELTGTCNQSCLHCYNYWRVPGQKPQKEMGLRQLEVVIGKLAEAGVFGLVLTGGEPLINPRECCRLIRAIREKGMDVSLNSNLTLLTPDLARKMKDGGLKSILTSLLGPNESLHDSLTHLPGSFKRFRKGVRYALDEALPLTVNMVVTKANKAFVRETARFVKEEGISSFCATRAGCPGNCENFSSLGLNKEELIECLEDLLYAKEELGLKVDTLEPLPLCGISSLSDPTPFTSRRCVAGVTTCTVGTNGSVRPCSHLSLSYGNILNQEFERIWESMTDSWATGAFYPQECKECKLFSRCGGGCRMVAELKGEKAIEGVDIYASLDLIGEAATKLSKPITPPAVKEGDYTGAFKILPHRRRKEKFGGIIMTPTGSALLLDQSGWSIVSQLEPGFLYRSTSEVPWGDVNPTVFLKKMAQQGGALLVSTDQEVVSHQEGSSSR